MAEEWGHSVVDSCIEWAYVGEIQPHDRDDSAIRACENSKNDKKYEETAQNSEEYVHYQ